MDYVSLGRTGVQVSRLGLGCWMFGAPTELSEACVIIDRAIEAGINLLDTANNYNQGRSEEVIGEALKRNGKRHTLILATKVHRRVGPGPNDWGNSRRHIVEQCEASLRRLQTDHIDLYQVHRPQRSIPIDETLRALDDLIHAGKVLYIGTSTFPAWQIVESLWRSKENRLNRFVAEQPPYNLLDRTIEQELIPMAQAYGLAILPWSPLAGGLLTGKYARGQEPPSDSRYARALNPARWYQFQERGLGAVEQLQALAATKGCTLSQFALAWCMQQPGVTSPLIGPRTVEQLQDNLGALDIQITVEDRRRTDSLLPPGTSAVCYYAQA